MPETGRNRGAWADWKQLYPLLIIALAGFIAYANTFQVPFVFDDDQYIVQNPAVKDFRYYYDNSFTEQAISQAKFDDNFRTRKVTFFTFALNYHLHGLNLQGYHAFNLMVHLTSGLLVYLLAVFTLQTPSGRNGGPEAGHPGLAKQLVPLFTSLLFVVHPLQTQAVTYICQRFTSLATMLCLLALVLYIRWRLGVARNGQPDSQDPAALRGHGAWVLYCLSLVSTVLAMFTKEISFTLPLIIILYEWMFFGRPSARQLFLLLPFAATMLIIPLVTFSAESHYSDIARLTGSLAKGADQNFAFTYLLTQFRVIVIYLRLLMLPIGQNLIHDIPTYTSFLQPPVFLSFLFLCLLAGLAGFLSYRASHLPHGQGNWQRLIAFGIFWFFISLSVESSFIPLNDPIFEHRMYRPMAGAVFALLGLGELLRQRLNTSGLRFAAVLSVAVLIVLAVATYSRNNIWRVPITLWEDAARKSPNRFRPILNLGTEYARVGRHEEAIRLYKKALLLSTGYSKSMLVYSALENTYKTLKKEELLQRNYQEYLAMLQDALKKNSNDPVLFSHLGILYGKMGRFAEAKAAFLKAMELKPDNALTHANLGSLYLSQNRPVEALKFYREAVRLDPENAEAQKELGDGLAASGDFKAAQAAYIIAMKLNPELPDIYNKVANLYVRAGNRAMAEKVLLQAVATHSDDPKVHNDLGVYYADQNRITEAEREYRTALDLDDSLPEIYLNIANIYLKQGRFDEALELLNRSAMLAPQNPEIHNMMGYAYFQKGDFQASAKACRRVVELTPSDAAAKKRLDQVLQMLNGNNTKGQIK